MKEIIEIINFALDGIEHSKSGLETYTDDCEADHGDGQQVGREAAYLAVINQCARILQEKTKARHEFEF